MDSLSGTPPRRDQHPLQAYFIDSLHPFRSLGLGAFFYWTGCFENNVPVRQYRSDLSDQPALETRVRT